MRWRHQLSLVAALDTAVEVGHLWWFVSEQSFQFPSSLVSLLTSFQFILKTNCLISGGEPAFNTVESCSRSTDDAEIEAWRDRKSVV